MSRPRPCRRFGFTLVELLVVILILAILAALLLPAILSAIRTARSAAVLGEITNMGQALADFKSRYGEYPPSRILLREDGAFDTTGNTTTGNWLGLAPVLGPTDITYAQLAQRSLRYLRKFFPRVNFSSTSVPIFPPTSTVWYDFNGDGRFAAGQDILLEGHEALVFFLGGIPNYTGGVISMSGFGKSPTNPFLNATVTTNRLSPFFEFNSSRLVDNDADGMPGYLDSLATGSDSRFYAYFSSYTGGSYDPNDVNFNEPDDNGVVTSILGGFRINFAVTGPNGATNIDVSPAPNPYTSGSPLPLNPAQSGLPIEQQDLFPTAPGQTAWQNPESFQIISPGIDRFYGIGGWYNSSLTTGKLPFPAKANMQATGQNNQTATGNASDPAYTRQRESDNLASFATQKLD